MPASVQLEHVHFLPERVRHVQLVPDPVHGQRHRRPRTRHRNVVAHVVRTHRRVQLHRVNLQIRNIINLRSIHLSHRKLLKIIDLSSFDIGPEEQVPSVMVVDAGRGGVGECGGRAERGRGWQGRGGRGWRRQLQTEDAALVGQSQPRATSAQTVAARAQCVPRGTRTVVS